MDQGHQNTAAARPNRMTKSHRAAVHVNLIPIPIITLLNKFRPIGQNLGRKGFIQFHQVNIGHRPTNFVQQPGNSSGRGGKDPLGSNGRMGVTNNTGNGSRALSFGLGSAGNNQGGSAIV
jgi:hypothetical protein